MLVEAPPDDLKANPTLRMVHQVERVLRAAAAKRESPLSYAEIMRRMPAKAVRFDTVKAAVMELARHKEVSIGSKGVSWIVVPDAVWQKRHEPLA